MRYRDSGTALVLLADRFQERGEWTRPVTVDTCFANEWNSVGAHNHKPYSVLIRGFHVNWNATRNDQLIFHPSVHQSSDMEPVYRTGILRLTFWAPLLWCIVDVEPCWPGAAVVGTSIAERLLRSRYRWRGRQWSWVATSFPPFKHQPGQTINYEHAVPRRYRGDKWKRKVALLITRRLAAHVCSDPNQPSKPGLLPGPQRSARCRDQPNEQVGGGHGIQRQTPVKLIIKFPKTYLCW